MPKYHCWPLRVWCISGSRALSAFLVELGALMMVASTMVPVLTLKPRSCNSCPTLANRASPSLLSLSSLRNFNIVVASATGSRPSNAHKVAQAGAVVQGFLTGQIRQVEPVLDEVDAQHAFQTNGWASVARFGVVGLDNFTQLSPWHDGLHGLEELVATRRLAVMLVS